jgi:hypothetical protein
MSIPNALDGFIAQLTRRGLPIEYAERAGAELADHYGDLVTEQRAAGLDEPAAAAEATRRLGDSRMLVRKTVREYQRRYWCGRWPLISFVLAPIPAFICAWFVASLVSFQTYKVLGCAGEWLGMAAPAPATIGILKLILLGGSTAVAAPLALTFLYCRLARRAGCGRPWAALSVVQIAFLAGLLNFGVDYQRGILFFEPTGLRGIFFAPTFTAFLQSCSVQPLQAVQFAIPLAAFGLLVWHERHEQRIQAASIGLLALY